MSVPSPTSELMTTYLISNLKVVVYFSYFQPQSCCPFPASELLPLFQPQSYCPFPNLRVVAPFPTSELLPFLFPTSELLPFFHPHSCCHFSYLSASKLLFTVLLPTSELMSITFFQPQSWRLSFFSRPKSWVYDCFQLQSWRLPFFSPNRRVEQLHFSNFRVVYLFYF